MEKGERNTSKLKAGDRSSSGFASQGVIALPGRAQQADCSWKTSSVETHTALWAPVLHFGLSRLILTALAGSSYPHWHSILQKKELRSRATQLYRESKEGGPWTPGPSHVLSASTWKCTEPKEMFHRRRNIEWIFFLNWHKIYGLQSTYISVLFLQGSDSWSG